MNDLVDYVQNSHVYLYADDLKLLCVDCFDGLQCDINGIYEWSINNQLEFHPEKCKAMNFKCSQSALFLGEAEILFNRDYGFIAAARAQYLLSLVIERGTCSKYKD